MKRTNEQILKDLEERQKLILKKTTTWSSLEVLLYIKSLLIAFIMGYVLGVIS